MAEYLSELPADRRAALAKLRRLIRTVAPEAKETMQYGMPAYELDGLLCGLASQKNYMAFYLCDTATVKAHREQLRKLNCGKSCIRFRKLEDLPLDVIRAILRDARAKRIAERA